MTSSLLRATLAVCALIGLSAGCASGRPRTRSENLERSADDPIEKRLQAADPSILVSRTADGSIAVRIRGSSSFYAGTEPLYVIDDVPIQPGPGGALKGVNPYDIESIKVLKNPSDTAIYGVRGANGVILIKTKRPGKRPDDNS